MWARSTEGNVSSGDALNRFFLSPSVLPRRCVEIIAKEGRSLKELYLVSCKITDHGRNLCTTVPTLQSTSKIIIRSTVIAPSHRHDSGLICFLRRGPYEGATQLKCY